MAKFKIAMSFCDCCFEEITEINAISLKKAEEQCEQIKQKNNEYVEFLKLKNIYTSRIIKRCRVLMPDWREDLLRCVNFLEKEE